MKADEVHKFSDDEIKSEVERLRKEIFGVRSQAVTERLENPRQARNLRRDLARVLTERRKRQLQQQKA